MQNQYVRLSKVETNQNRSAKLSDDNWYLTVMELNSIFYKAREITNHYEDCKLTLGKENGVKKMHLVLPVEDFLSLCKIGYIPEEVSTAFAKANAVLLAHDQKRAARGGPLWAEFVMAQAEKGLPAAIASCKVEDDELQLAIANTELFVSRGGLVPKPKVP